MLAPNVMTRALRTMIDRPIVVIMPGTGLGPITRFRTAAWRSQPVANAARQTHGTTANTGSGVSVRNDAPR